MVSTRHLHSARFQASMGLLHREVTERANIVFVTGPFCTVAGQLPFLDWSFALSEFPSVKQDGTRAITTSISFVC